MATSAYDDDTKETEEGFALLDISPDEIEQCKATMKTPVIDTAREFMQEKLNKWKDQPLNCGITGASGTGKSSFINTVRGLTVEGEGAAEVDVVECTTVPTPYSDPSNANLNYWELPGVGTPDFPKDNTYLNKIKFERYDFFLIVAAVRFTENDLWLAKQIQNVGKQFFFVRTKIDNDLDNEKRSRPKKFKGDQVIQKIRHNCKKHLADQGFSSNFFLVSNLHPELFDFPALCINIINCLPELKREAMILSLRSFSRQMAEEKGKVMRGRIWIVSTLSAAGGLVALPGVSVVADVALIMNELHFYKEQFGLTQNFIDIVERKAHGTNKERILGHVGYICKAVTKESVMEMLKHSSTSVADEEVSPLESIIGPIVASAVSFGITYKMLGSELTRLENISNEVMSATVEYMTDDLDPHTWVVYS